MGASQSNTTTKSESDITICSICQEEFKTPKCLPCLHTFCQSCLNSYIIAAFENKPTNKLEFNCPVCNSTVLPPDPSAKYQEWARQFPLDHFIYSLTSQNKLKDKTKLCDPCESTNGDVTAVVWCLECNEALCEICADAHKKLKISKEHVLKNINELDKIPLITSLQTCEHHIGRGIEGFCRDHSQPCCPSCVAIYHRKCDCVVPLEEAANGVLESKELSDLLQRLKDTSALNKSLMQEKLETIQTMENQKNDIQKELQEIRKKIMNKFDELQSAFMEEFTQKHNHKVTKLKDAIKTIENKDKAIQNFTKLMETGKTRTSDTHLFLEMKKVLDREQKDVEVLEQILSKHKSVEYEFRVNDDVKKVITELQKVGQIKVVENPSLSDRRYPHIAGP